MKTFRILLLSMLCGVLPINRLFSQDFISDLLRQELSSHYNSLQKQSTLPYFMGFRLSETQTYVMGASFGSLIADEYNRGRMVSCETRIGSYEFDNTHPLNKMGYGLSSRSVELLPVDDSILPITNSIRECADAAYKSALEEYEVVMQAKDTLKIKSDDFSKQEKATYFEPSVPANIPAAYWKDYLKKITAEFNKESYIMEARAMLTALSNRNYYTNTEGTLVVQNSFITDLSIAILFSCEDGNMAPYVKTYQVRNVDQLPTEQQLMDDMAEIKILIKKLRSAPLAESYSGPAILSAKASGVFFHEIFGHRVEGHRLRQTTDSHTFKNQLGEKILPDQMSITYDPTVAEYKGIPLYGHYKFDDEGVSARKVEVVKEGKFIQYLMSRQPVEGNAVSNGHGRGELGLAPVSRQSNLFVSSKSYIPEKDMHEKLRKMCKKQNKEYGYLFDEVIGGFTNTDRISANAFNIIPILVHKVYTDGRPDELVRGVTLIGTPLTMFSEIEACGGQQAVFNGYCGAESGSVPTSTIAPSLLVNKIETQRQFEIKCETPQICSPDQIK
ncbi:MAG: metallopeptidase TldD-related protein [Bacteroidales bacterium]|nr:metallopeptidase TldD-related protein [Bacteroidales bacterium]